MPLNFQNYVCLRFEQMSLFVLFMSSTYTFSPRFSNPKIASEKRLNTSEYIFQN